MQSRLAGILYLVTDVSSLLAVAAYGNASNAAGVRAGVALEFVLALGCAGTGILLYVLLHTAGEVRALTFAILRALEAATILAGTLPMLAIVLTGGTGSTGAPSRTLIALHTASFLVGQGLVIGVNTIVLGSLLLSSGLVPRALALLGIAGGALVLASDLAQLFGLIPLNGAVAGVCAVPILVFELWLAITLIAVGLRPRRNAPPVSAAQPS